MEGGVNTPERTRGSGNILTVPWYRTPPRALGSVTELHLWPLGILFSRNFRPSCLRSGSGGACCCIHRTHMCTSEGACDVLRPHCLVLLISISPLSAGRPWSGLPGQLLQRSLPPPATQLSLTGQHHSLRCGGHTMWTGSRCGCQASMEGPLCHGLRSRDCALAVTAPLSHHMAVIRMRWVGTGNGGHPGPLSSGHNPATRCGSS